MAELPNSPLPENCTRCGYSTLGLSTDTCPECGAKLVLPEDAPPAPEWSDGWLGSRGIAIVATLAGTIAGTLALLTLATYQLRWAPPVFLVAIVAVTVGGCEAARVGSTRFRRERVWLFLSIAVPSAFLGPPLLLIVVVLVASAVR